MSTTPVGTPDPDNQPVHDNVRVLRPAGRSTVAPCGACKSPQTACEQISQQHQGIRCCGQCTHPRPGGELEPAPPVIEAEVLSEEESAALDLRLAAQALARHVGKGSAQVARSAKHVATHDATRQAGRFVARHTVYVAKGAEAARQRKRAERSQADARAARAAALAAGDLAQVAALNKQIQEARHTSVDVWGKWAGLAWDTSKKGLFGGCAVTGGALVVGVVNGIGHWLGDWSAADVLHALGATITTTGEVVGFSVTHWWAFAAGGVGVWSFRRWKDGRRLGDAALPAHLRRDGARIQYVQLTESLLASALGNIGNTKLNALIKEGWPNRDTDNAWVQPPTMDAGGKGWSVKIRLPMGASVAAVNRAKELMAHNLGCRPQELFLDPWSEDSTVLDLYRLEPGVLREPVPDYPLLDNGSTDYWSGFPVGISPRGEEVTGATFERNYVVSGMMGSGKTSLILALLTGAVLDPLVDIDVFVFAENADYDVLEPCLATLSKGDTPENVQACMDHMQGLHQDLAERGRLLSEHGEGSVTRALAAKEPRLRPRIVVIDECQSFFRQDKPEDRRKVVNMMVRFFSAARKYGVTCVFATPVPSDQSLPRDLVAVTSNLACGAIKDKTRNNVVLGDKAHENGISAMGLAPAEKKNGKIVALNDVGTLITVGYMNRPGAVRSYNVTRDQQAQVVERALVLRGGRVARQERPAEQDRDLLADLVEVLGQDDPVPAANCKALLSREFPAWQPYRELTVKALVAQLADLGVKVASTGNKWLVYPERVRQAAAGRGDDDPRDGE